MGKIDVAEVLGNVILFVCLMFFIILSSLVIVPMYAAYADKAFCEAKIEIGAFSDSSDIKLKEGYVQCCKWEYTDGLGEKVCEVIKKDRGGK